MNNDQFVAELSQKKVNLTNKQLTQFDQYYRLLLEWNQKMNLTGLTEREQVYTKHFYDSISPAFFYDFSTLLTMADIGSGAGFPSLPLKICFPHLEVDIVDSLQKRIRFLEHVVAELQLDHVQLHHDRAETFSQKKEHRQRYDLVTARAVARLHVLSELCLPAVKVGGLFVAMKGAQVEEEAQEAGTAIAQLGGQVEQIDHFELPNEEGRRTMIWIQKVNPSPKKYPRKPGTPKKDPII